MRPTPAEMGLTPEQMGIKPGQQEAREQGAESAEVQDMIERISQLSPEQRQAVADYLNTGKLPETDKPATGHQGQTERVESPVRKVESRQEFERLYPKVKLFFGKEPGVGTLQKLSQAFERASSRIGAGSFNQLDIRVTSIGDEVKVDQNEISIGAGASVEDMVEIIVDNTESILAGKEKQKSDAETGEILFELTQSFTKEFKQFGFSAAVRGIENPKKFSDYLNKLRQILTEIKDKEGAHRIKADISLNDSGGSHEESTELILDLSEDPQTIKQAILDYTKFNRR